MQSLILIAAIVAADPAPKAPVAVASTTTPAAAAPATLRVCADPDNLPFSNKAEEGLENAIAKIVAREMKAQLQYYWWPHQRGLLKRTLKAGQCDVILGMPSGMEGALTTRPYYRTGYVMAYRADRGYKLENLDAPELKKLKVGVQNNTPPWAAMGRREIVDNVIEYTLFHDQGDPDRTGMPEGMFKDLTDGKLDVAMMWGPMAGYFAKKTPNVKFVERPLKDEERLPMAYDIAIAVPKGQEELKAKLEAALDHAAPEIDKVLQSYGVPVLPMGHGGSGTQASATDAKGEHCEHHE